MLKSIKIEFSLQISRIAIVMHKLHINIKRKVCVIFFPLHRERGDQKKEEIQKREREKENERDDCMQFDKN